MKKFNQYIKEDLGGALVEPKSASAEQAKQLGLVYVGFGRYEDPRTQQVTHIVQNDRLVPFSKAMKTNTFKQQSSDDYGNYVKGMMPDIQQNHSELSSYYMPENYEDNELDAIEAYTGIDFLDMNDKLYTLPVGIPADQIQPEFEGDDIGQKIAALDSALDKVAAPKDFITYTGLDTSYNVEDFVPGRVFRFKGFRSTSLNTNIALNYNSRVNVTSGRKQTILLQIRVKKGSKGMYVDEFSVNPGESEYLLPRGSKVRIKGGPNKLIGSNAYSQDPNLEVLYFDCDLVK
jgi:hypothetical protein